MSEAHEAPIKNSKQLIALIIASFALPVIIIALLVNYVDNSARSGAGTDGLSDEQVARRIAPIAHVEIRDANAPRVYKSGEEVFKAVCSTCHSTGVAGAPKFGNSGDWAPRIAQGYETLVKTALAGKGAMPARGGASPDDYSDYEIERAIVYMANAAGAHFSEPPAPAAGAANAAAGSTGQAAAPAAGATPASGNAETAAASSGAGGQAAAAAATIAAIPSAPSAASGGAGATTTASADASQAGKALYQQVCQACHAAGVAGAPKFGDKAAWAPRLKEPMDTIYNYALHGKGAMPPKGGSSASDADVKAAVDYMVSAAK
jgi:cytochrome c5